MKHHFKAAIQNVANFGDTDIFPFPIENSIFFDQEELALKLLEEMHKEFQQFLENYPPFNENNLSVVGYTGFRYGTQIDPMWNAYLLALVISIGDDIENVRIPIEREAVFSYRFKQDKDAKSIFDSNIGWAQFQEVSVKRAKEHSHILICDIADFYPRIYDHRLENALAKATKNTDIVKRIMHILNEISGNVSYGLPVGGPAARLLRNEN